MQALFILNGSTRNRGCEAILLSTWQLLREAMPNMTAINSSFLDPRAGREAYLNLPGLLHRCHPEPRSLQFLGWQWAKRVGGKKYNFERFLDRSDVVFSLGGDNYSLDYGSVGKYLDANDRVLAAGKPLVIWGASVGPFSAEPEIEERVRQQFQRVALIVAREQKTVEYLDGLGLRDKVILLPDPAFSLSPAPIELRPLQKKMLEAGAVGVNLSPLLARYRNGHEEWLEEAVNWIRYLMTSAGRPVLLVPHVFEPGNDDQDFLEGVRRRIDAPANELSLLDGRTMSCRQIKNVIGQLHAFIGARTHATIAAMSMGVPTLSIGYSVKATGINEDVFGSIDWVVSHKALDGPELARRNAELDAAAPTIRTHLQNQAQEYRISSDDIKNMLSRVGVIV